MTRFDYEYDDEGIPYELWQHTLSMALGSEQGQQALAEMEEALLALPSPRLIHGRLAEDGGVCAIGARVAYCNAQQNGTSVEDEIAAMTKPARCECGHAREAHAEYGGPCSKQASWDSTRRCYCNGFHAEHEDAFETVEAGRRTGLRSSIAWHLAYLNDEQFASATPEERHEQMLGWIRRALGKTEEANTND